MSFDKKKEVLIKENHTKNKAKALDEELISNSGEDSEEEIDKQKDNEEFSEDSSDSEKKNIKKEPKRKKDIVILI